MCTVHNIQDPYPESESSLSWGPTYNNIDNNMHVPKFLDIIYTELQILEESIFFFHEVQ